MNKLVILLTNKEQLKAFLDCKDALFNIANDVEVYCSFESPYGAVCPKMERKESSVKSAGPVVIYTLEQLSKRLIEGSNKDIILHNSIPILNSHTYDYLKEIIGEKFRFIASFELTTYEIKHLKDALGDDSDNMLLPLYGYIPLMISAGCNHSDSIVDRKGVLFTIERDCDECINTIYNSLPFSGHDMVFNDKKIMSNAVLEFTIEDYKGTIDVLKYYIDILGNISDKKPEFKYTTGHLKRAID